MSSPPPSPQHDLGQWGEEFVAKWLEKQGWTILERRWHCRWGELDLVAQFPLQQNVRSHFNQSPTLSPQFEGKENEIATGIAFIEVKTRSQGSWDANGLQSITPAKQQKLWQAAHLFLADYPELAVLPCRFDVALVYHQRFRSAQPRPVPTPKWVAPSPQIGYTLVLQDYIPAAFELSE